MGERLAGKVAIVTGAGSSGAGWSNGKAVAVLFAREGAHVVISDRDADAAEATARAIRAEDRDCSTVVADVTDEASVEALFRDAMARHGRIDVLHNNVGITVTGGPEDLLRADWDRALATNLTSAFLTTKAALPLMAAGGGGSIVNVSSISSLRWLRGLSYVSYPVSKAALNQFTRVVAAQYGPKKIRCNAILPGFIMTPMVERSVLSALRDEGATIETYAARRAANVPLGCWGDAFDVAAAALFLASDESRYVTGIELVVDGGATLLAG